MSSRLCSSCSAPTARACNSCTGPLCQRCSCTRCSRGGALSPRLLIEDGARKRWASDLKKAVQYQEVERQVYETTLVMKIDA